MKRRNYHHLGSALLLAAGLMPAAGKADTIVASTTDARFRTASSGNLVGSGPEETAAGEVYIGRKYYGNGENNHFVVPFALPDLGEGIFSDVVVGFRPSGKNQTLDVNLWAIPGSRADSTTLQSDVNNGTDNHTARGILIKDTFWSGATGTGSFVTTGAGEEAALADWLNAAYANGGNANNYVFMRLSSKVLWPGSDDAYFNVSTANSGSAPYLSYTFTPVDPNAPAVASFTATPATINGGGSATLSWSVSGADSVTIDNGVGTVNFSGGTFVVSPAATTTYTLSATNSFGTRVRKATVTVLVPQSVTLAAHTNDAEFATNPDSGAVVGGPSETTAQTVYIGRKYYGNDIKHYVVPFQLPDLGPGGFTGVRVNMRPSTGYGGQPGNFNVNLFAIPDARDTAAPLQTDVNDGTHNHLSRGLLMQEDWWTPATPMNTMASTDAGGQVAQDLSDWLTEAYANGTNAGKFVFLRLSPDVLSVSGDRGYTVSAQDNGTANRRPTLTATYDPTIVGPPGITFTADPSGINPGESSTLTWSVTGADTVSIDNGVGAVATSGTQEVSPAATTTYTLTATGAGGTREKSVTVTVLGPGPFRYYRFVPTALRDPGAGMVQISEFQMLMDGSRLGGATASNPGGSSPGGEGPQQANDNNLGSKWLDFNIQPLVLDFGTTTDVNGYRWATANDSDDRDPVGWRVEGSHDNANWQLIDEKTNQTVTTNRETYLSAFPIEPFGGGPSATFTASPSSILTGGSATLTWNVTGADTVSIDNGIGAVAASGTQEVSPTGTTTYTLTAQNAQGTTTKTATVTVILGLPITYSFEDAGVPSFQGWTNVGGQAWSVTSGWGDARSQPGVVKSSTHDSAHATMILRSLEFVLNGNGDLIAYIGGGNSRIPSVNGPCGNLPANSVNEGGFMGLALRKVSTDEYLISLPKSVGGQSPDDSSRHTIPAATLNALLAAAPNETYTVDIIDSNHGGWGWTVVDDVTIPGNLDTPGVPQITFTGSPSVILTGNSATLEWFVTNATSVNIDNGVGTVTASGSTTVSPGTTTTYTLTAVGDNATRTATVTITVASGGLLGATFDTLSGSGNLDPISNLINATPDGTFLQAGEISYPDNSFLGVLPGLTSDDDFSVLWTGWFDVSKDGSGDYTFGVGSDDASVIYLDLNGDGQFDGPGEKIVSTGGGGGANTGATGTVNLTMGAVRVAIGYEEGGGEEIMYAKFAKGASLPYTSLNPVGGLSGHFFPAQPPAVPVVAFSATPATISLGGSSTLTWNVTNADTISIDQGIGTVAASGSAVVSPTSSITYTLTATNANGTRTATASVVVPSGPLAVFDFDDHTFQGWTDLTVPNTNDGPRNWTASGTAPDGLFLRGGEQSGAGAIEQVIAGHEDNAHPTLLLRSPEFTLNGSGDLTTWLNGGPGAGSLAGTPVANLPANSSAPGFQGLALRNVNTGTYVLSVRKPGEGDWQQVTLTAAQLAGLDQAATYTLDLIDAGSGGWGWVSMDTVAIPGNFGGTQPPYDSWAATKGLTGPSAAFGADPDNDGIDNGIEFVTDGEPNPANGGGARHAGMPVSAVSGGYLVVTYTQADDAAYLDPHIEFATDLAGPWTRAVDRANATIQVTDNGPTDTVTVFIPMNADPVKFARLKVVGP